MGNIISIVIKFQIEGIHYWENAKDYFPEVAFLSNPHRHIFFIECIKEVDHADRDIEIIMFARKVKDYLHSKYFDEDINCCNFNRLSCEEIALELVKVFKLYSCSVLEDNENGAFIKKENEK